MRRTLFVVMMRGGALNVHCDRGAEFDSFLVCRMAEFVSRGIDNSAKGLTTQKAMQKLGLQE